jgi:hypothetical protein
MKTTTERRQIHLPVKSVKTCNYREQHGKVLPDYTSSRSTRQHSAQSHGNLTSHYVAFNWDGQLPVTQVPLTMTSGKVRESLSVQNIITACSYIRLGLRALEISKEWETSRSSVRHSAPTFWDCHWNMWTFLFSALFAHLKKRVKVGLCHHHAVCIFPLATSECLH